VATGTEFAVIRRLWRLFSPDDRRRLASIAPLLVLAALVEVVGVAAVMPFLALLADPDSLAVVPFVGPWLARVDAGADAAALPIAGFVLASLLVLANLLLIATSWWVHRFAWGLNHALSARLLRHYLRQPYAFLLQRNTAELTNKVIVEVRQLCDQGVRAGLELLTRSTVIAALVAFLVVLDPLLATVAFLSLGTVYGLIYRVSRRYLQRIGREIVVAGAARLKAVNEALGGFKDLRVAGRELAAYEQYLPASRRFGEVQAAVGVLVMVPRYALEAVAVGGVVVVASLLSGRPDGTVAALPVLGAYAFAGLRLMPAMQSLFGAVARLRFVSGALDAIEIDLALQTDLEADDHPDDPPYPFARAIALEAVAFAYPGDDGEPALHGVDLVLERNRSLAIVGRTGSGKSTIVDLLLGLLTPGSGRVTVDGAPVPPERRRAYRRLFGYVPQSIYLLDDTIARNVAFGRRDADIDHEAVRAACRQAQIAHFIETELVDGYATRVGERGVRLSGGQRQRIGIARALYHQPAVLVFDEATSALDVHTEQQVYEALEAIARERTVVTIAHRLETVAQADRVVVIDGGRVVDEGPPQAVLARYRPEVGA
jgi:ATP-binding cassette, subfamily B, bacterial PglK